jgi:hypothetical protein
MTVAETPSLGKSADSRAFPFMNCMEFPKLYSIYPPGPVRPWIGIKWLTLARRVSGCRLEQSISLCSGTRRMKSSRTFSITVFREIHTGSRSIVQDARPGGVVPSTAPTKLRTVFALQNSTVQYSLVQYISRAIHSGLFSFRSPDQTLPVTMHPHC